MAGKVTCIISTVFLVSKQCWCFLYVPYLLKFVLLITWNQFNFQEGYSVVIEIVNYFHDYMIRLLIFIIIFVTYVFLYVSFSPYLEKITNDSHILETVWTVLPIGFLLFIAFPSLFLLYTIDELSSPSITVKVLGHQWYWEYEYSSSWFDITFDSYILYESSNYPLFHTLDVDNRLILPFNVNILLLISSSDVLHSWTVPCLGVKADACPGRLNYLSLKSANIGVFYGQCREICGSNHRFMPVCVEFIPISSFINYVNSL